MYELKAENWNGEVLDFSASSEYTVYKITGLNPVKANITSVQNATVDGSVFKNARVEKRNIVLYIHFNGNIEEARINLYKYFTPKYDTTIYFKNESRNVYIKGKVESVEIDLFSVKQFAQISIICNNPYFKDIEALITEFSQMSDGFQFPFSIEESGIELSALTNDSRVTILNRGEIETGMIITLYASGTVVNPVIYDVRRKTHIKLNMTLQDSDKVEINTNFNEKYIKLYRSGSEINSIGNLYPTSTWITLLAGDNVFTYNADSGASSLQIEIESNVLYGGV